MADQNLSEQAREAVLQAILKAAPKVINSPAGVRDLAEAYVKFMFSDEGQEIVAKRFNRPINPEILKKHADQYPAVKQFTLKDVFGDWDAVMKKHFENDGVFDQILK